MFYTTDANVPARSISSRAAPLYPSKQEKEGPLMYGGDASLPERDSTRQAFPVTKPAGKAARNKTTEKCVAQNQ